MGTITEDSVGTLLPIKEPSEVLRKDVEPSIDDSFNAIRLTENIDEAEEEVNINESVGVDMGIKIINPSAGLMWTCIAMVVIPIGVTVALEVNARRRLQELEAGYATKDKKFIPLSSCEHRMFNLDYAAFNAFKSTGKSNHSIEDIVKMRYGDEITKFKALRSKINRVHELWYKNELVAAFLIESEQANGSGYDTNGDVSTVTVRKNNLYVGLNKKYKKYEEYQTAYIGFMYCRNEHSLKIINQLYAKETKKDYNEDCDTLDNGVPLDITTVETASSEGFQDLLRENGIQSVISELEKQEDVMGVWGEEWEDDDIYTESAKIDDDIKDIISTLNKKGYVTVYSCSGHPSVRLKSDRLKDGIKNGKLYSTARIVFDKNYEFDSIPKYWELKILDKGQSGIYVKGPTYNIVNGMAPDQFARWKKRYMYNLEKWANALPDAGTQKPKTITEEFQETTDSLVSVTEDVLLSAIENVFDM